MTKRELLERIEELERRVTYLEAVAAARPAEPEAYTATVTPVASPPASTGSATWSPDWYVTPTYTTRRVDYGAAGELRI